MLTNFTWSASIYDLSPNMVIVISGSGHKTKNLDYSRFFATCSGRSYTFIVIKVSESWAGGNLIVTKVILSKAHKFLLILYRHVL